MLDQPKSISINYLYAQNLTTIQIKKFIFSLFLLTKQLKKHSKTLSKPSNNSKNLKLS
jgi:hypothetical protein